MSDDWRQREWSNWINLSKTVNRVEIGWTVVEKSRPEHDSHEHVCAICCRPEVAGDVISGRNVQTVDGYVVVNCKVSNYSSFRDIKKSLRDGGGGGNRQYYQRQRFQFFYKDWTPQMTILLSTVHWMWELDVNCGNGEANPSPWKQMLKDDAWRIRHNTANTKQTMYCNRSVSSLDIRTSYCQPSSVASFHRFVLFTFFLEFGRTTLCHLLVACFLSLHESDTPLPPTMIAL